MNSRNIYRLLFAGVLVLVSTGIALAHDVRLFDPAKLANGPELQPGTYRVEVVKGQDASEALFYKGKDLVVRVPVKLVQESAKSPHTAIHLDTIDGARVITQIRVAGWKESLVFERTAQEPVATQ